MKSIACLTFILVSVAIAAAVGDDQISPKPQGMTLRLELFVSDLEKSIDFYTKVLEFERLNGQSDYVPVRSGSVVIGLGPSSKLSKSHYFNPELQTSRRGLGAEIVLEVDDVQAFFEKVKASGYKRNLSPLRKQSWGATDFRIVDPDGYYLRITSR
jgi:catechol 2,3-dioxygenase-like lactoylglutathione lyase family enzyme